MCQQALRKRDSTSRTETAGRSVHLNLVSDLATSKFQWPMIRVVISPCDFGLVPDHAISYCVQGRKPHLLQVSDPACTADPG